MIAKFSTFTVFLMLALCVAGQDINNDTAGHNLFTKGIYLEDLNITIPWYANFEDLEKYGNPKIDITKKGMNVRWDSVKILNGVNINLRHWSYKTFSGKNKYSKLRTLYGIIDRSDIEKIKSYLESYSGIRADLNDTKNKTSYFWIIDGCNVRLGYWKGRWQQYGSFLDIQKK